MLIEGDSPVSDTPAAEGAASGSSEQNGTPGDGGKGGEQPTIESLQQQLAEAQQREQAAQMRLLDPDYIEYVAQGKGGGRRDERLERPARTAPKDPLEGLTDEKLNAMTNRDIIATAVERTVGAVMGQLREELLPEIESRIAAIGDVAADTASRREVDVTAAKYPDFWKYQKEMVALSVQPKYERLGAEDLYLLVKASKGGIVTPPAGTTEQRRSAAAHTDKPGTTGGGGAATSKKGQEMSAEEAAQEAWTKVFGQKK